MEAIIAEFTPVANLTRVVVVKSDVRNEFAAVVEADPLRLAVLDTSRLFRDEELALDWEDGAAEIERVSVTTGFPPVEALAAILLSSITIQWGRG